MYTKIDDKDLWFIIRLLQYKAQEDHGPAATASLQKAANKQRADARRLAWALQDGTIQIHAMNARKK